MSHRSRAQEVEPSRRRRTQRRRVAGVVAQYIHELSDRRQRDARGLAAATPTQESARE